MMSLVGLSNGLTYSEFVMKTFAHSLAASSLRDFNRWFFVLKVEMINIWSIWGPCLSTVENVACL